MKLGTLVISPHLISVAAWGGQGDIERDALQLKRQ